MKRNLTIALAIGLMCLPAQADSRPDSHAPIGVMGEHYHKQGEFMFSFRSMSMSMEGNRDGTSSISAEEIATTIPNRFFGIPGQPPTLRVVPTKMTMDMQMFGVMYAPTDRVTLMGMIQYIEKEMDHITYAGPTGTAQLGTFTTESSGLGDTPLTALIRLKQAGHSKWHATAGVSLPTADIDETGVVLAPTGGTPTLRLPYPMQLGSGTVDPIVGITYNGASSRFGWGGQWRSVFRVGDNDEDYTLGDEHLLTGWASVLLGSRASLSGRLALTDRGEIDGIDPQIVAPVQTADPDRQALQRVDAGLGLNFLLGSAERQRIALEAMIPLHQDLDGPQLETDWQVIFGYQFTVY